MTRFRPSLPLVLLGLFSALVVMLICPAQAQAAFTSGTSGGPTSVSTATLAPPTGVTLSTACGIVVLTTPTMTATWTPTASTYATGYTVTPYLNGAAQSPITVNGRASTSTTFNINRNTSLFSTDRVWTFTVMATFATSWTSTAASPTPASASCPFL